MVLPFVGHSSSAQVDVGQEVVHQWGHGERDSWGGDDVVEDGNRISIVNQYDMFKS